MAQQPPSGGCVLKHIRGIVNILQYAAAAFGRLCVETKLNKVEQYNIYSATTLSLNPIHSQSHSLLNFPLIRSRLCPIFSFHDLQLCVFLTFILTY